MRIAKGQAICGLPATEVRRLLRQAGERGWDRNAAARILDISPTAAGRLIAALDQEGLVEKDERDRTGRFWRLTQAGKRLSLATARRPISRATAERKVREFLDRVRCVNADPYYLYRFARVVVFGSFLGKSPDLGDIDLAVELVPKEGDRRRLDAALDERIAEATRGGRRFRDLASMYYYPQAEALRFAKGRSHSISLHDASDKILRSVKTKVIFRDRGRRHR